METHNSEEVHLRCLPWNLDKIDYLDKIVQKKLRFPPDGLLTPGITKHDVELDLQLIAQDPFTSKAYFDDITQTDASLLITIEGLYTMSTGEDEPSSAVNGRLRPRKSNPSSQTKKILRKSDEKNFQDKPKRINALPKFSPNKTDDLDNKSDNTTLQLLCPYCDKKFIYKQTASKHVHRIHLSSLKQDSNIDCLFCNHAEPEPNGIIRHMVDCHPNQYFACLECHTRFSSTSELAEHKLNVCEKQKLPYRSKLRQKPDGKKNLKSLNADAKDSFENQNKEFPDEHEFNGIVISCEPTQGRDEADIEDNITTNLILPSGKGVSHKAVIEKNAVIVLDDIQWNKRIPSTFSFNNTDADQILSRLGVVHKSPRSGESKKDCHKNVDDVPHKFEKCFDTNFYSKVARNVQENLSKYLDGSFNPNPEPNPTIKTRKSKNSIAINTAEGFPILLASEQYSRNLFDGYMPRAIAPKHKWKWDSPESDRDSINTDEMKRDAHLDNCIITYVSNLDIWTQLSMRRKFENKCNKPVEKRAEKQNIISNELKEILESREIPTPSPNGASNINQRYTPNSNVGASFPSMLGLTPTTPSRDFQPAVLSGEWARPRCYVCCACGAQTRDSRALSSHISTQHPNAYVQHYEIVGEHLLDADILKHLYVPPSQTINRSRPLRGFRECTKCKKSVTLEDLHQHMLDCAGDTPTIRRKCRHRPFGVRKRRPRLPDNRIRRKMRKDMRTGQSNDKNHLRPRPKTKSEVGDAETIRKMLADLPAKRHRVMVNPSNPFPRRKHDRKCNRLMVKKRSLNDRNYINTNEESSTTEGSDSVSTPKPNDCANDMNNEDEEDDDDLPLKPKLKATVLKSKPHKESFNRNATMIRTKRKSNKDFNLAIERANEAPVDYSDSNQPAELSINNAPDRININGGPNNVREHSNRGGSNNRDDQQPGSSRQNENSRDSVPPTQNVPLKHSIARLTADSETHDKSVQFHRLFLIQQECNNLDHRHLPSDRRLLFENEAVVTKLDKPPLHFNPRGAYDIQNQRKNKNKKPRKRLNDCIAMLKNKLTPNNEDDIPGHVSVQCGSDEPIEQEPYILEQSIYVPRLCEGTEKNPSQLPKESTQESPLEKLNLEHSKNNQLETTSMKDISESEPSTSLQCNINNEIESNEGDTTIITTQKAESPKYESVQLRKTVTPEIENTHTDTIPLPLPRNTVIRKSPKTSGNYANSQEDLRLPFKSTTIQVSESVNDSATDNLNSKQISNELTLMPPEGVSETNDRRQPLTITEHNDPEADKTLKKVENNPSNSYQINLNTQVNICDKEVRLSNGIEIEQNIVICPKGNVDLPLVDFSDIPCTIPPAHASTNVESIVSTPLDLSGKRSLMSVSSTEDTLANSYETLDLSNKNVGVDQASTLNTNLIDDLPSDVVVDLSIKSSQSNSANFSRKTTMDKNNEDLSYENIDDNLPTDLSVKKNNTTSTTMVQDSCGDVDRFAEDLSSNNTKRKEINPERAADIEYNIKDLPSDLSSSRINDSPLIIEILDNETDDLTNHEPHEQLPNVDNLRISAQERIYDNTGVNLIREMEESLINSTKNRIDTQAESTYMLQSIDVNKSVTPVLQQSILSRSEVPLRGASPCQLKDAEDKSNLATTTVCQNIDSATSQTSTTFIENTVIVPQDNIHYEIESAILGATTTSNSSLDHYSNNRNVTKQVPVCTFESMTSVRTSANVCISVAKADTSSLPHLVNTMPSIQSAPMPTTGTDYTAVETSVNSNNNFIDLSSETDSSKHQGDVSDDHYDLTKEEIIDCDAEQDNETARKIAMLPKELVKILGTMPIDHRKQLLDVLPQYVSTSASIESEELIDNQENMSYITSPPPVLQHMVPPGREYAEDSSKDLTHINKNETRSHARLNMCSASSSSSLLKSKDSIPQSVILKAPLASSDIQQSISKSSHDYTSIITPDVNRTVSVLNRPSNLITKEKAQSTIIDLTEDENIKDLNNDKQFIENSLPTLKAVSPCNQTVQCLSESPLQKCISDQTASLRAVRIKAPSERIKQAVSDGRKESLCANHIPEGRDYTDQQTLIMDIPKVDQERQNYTLAGDKNISNNEFYVSPVKKSNVSKSFDEQTNISGIILPKSSVILTPTSLEKNVKASVDERYGNHINQDITTFSSKLSLRAVNSKDDVIELNNTIASSLATEIDNDNFIETSTLPNKVNESVTNDEDSEDDVSLAVIVQQKQKKQADLSGDNIILNTRDDVTVKSKKRSKGKRSKKVLLKSLKNDDHNTVNIKTNVYKRLSAESIDIVSPVLNTAKNQLTTEDNTFAEKRKRKIRNRCEGVTSTEVLHRTYKIDDHVLALKVNVNPVAKGDMLDKKIEDDVECKKKSKDNIIHSHKQDQVPKDAITDNNDVVYRSSSSVEVRENFIESNINKERKNIQGSSDKSKEISEEICYVSDSNINFRNDTCSEKHQTKGYYINTDTIRDSCQLDILPLNNSGLTMEGHSNQQKSQDIHKIEQQGDTSPVNISGTDIKMKKGRGRKNKMKDSPDSHKQSTVTFETDEAPVTLLRRSRRGKSMFVDNALVHSGATNEIDVTIDKKAPLTKKQLIFSKLLLDEEKVSKPNIIDVIAKNPVVVINNVDLSSHIASTQLKVKNDEELEIPPISYSKPIKSVKRKKSPQIKRKAKKIKSLNNIREETVCKSAVLNNNDDKSEAYCQEESYDTTVQTSSNVLFFKDIGALPITEEKMNSSSTDIENKKSPNVQRLVGQSTVCDTTTTSITIEKRKIPSSLANAEDTYSSKSKKSKLDDMIESENANQVNNNDANESRRSRARNNHTETKNKTCYNHVAVRRTRSKSVGVKSSTLLYDPYDIDLEDMVDKDVSYGRRLKSSDNSFYNLSYVRRNEIKKINKCETSVGVNTEPINSDTMTEKTSNNTDVKEVSDSDDSSKSDVPLKIYAEEKEKKNLESISNKKVNNTWPSSEDKKTNKSEKKIEEVANQQNTNLQQDNHQGRKTEQRNVTNNFFSERKPRKLNVKATKKKSKTLNNNKIDDSNQEQTIEVTSTNINKVPNTSNSLTKVTSSAPTIASNFTTVTSIATTTFALVTTSSGTGSITITSSATDTTVTTAAAADTAAATALTTDATLITTLATGATAGIASVIDARASLFRDPTVTKASFIDATVTIGNFTDSTAATAPSTDATSTAPNAGVTVAPVPTADEETPAPTTDISRDATGTSDAAATTGTSSATTSSENDLKQEEDNISRDSSPSPSKKSAKRGRKKATCTKPLPCYCFICKKEFKRPDNYLRHQMTLLHISKLSEVEMKIKTTPVLEEPNFLIAYKQQLDRLKMLTEKVSKRKKTSKPAPKITIPTLRQILATVNKTVRDQQLSHRNLSRDEALFLDCCELLKESRKPEMSATTENITINTEVTNVSTTSQGPVAEVSGTTSNNAETDDNKNDGDVDSITAKNILESEEVRNLENDLISGLKEAAANSFAQAACNSELQQNQTRLETPENINVMTNPLTVKSQMEENSSSEKFVEEPSISKPKRSHESKEKMYPDVVVDSIDMFEDKFDKIKRKCRSQAAAAKQVKPVVEPRRRQKGRKKYEKKRGKKSTKKPPPAIPTKGALKVFDGIKVSIPTSEINMSGVVCSVENTPKKRKRNNTKKKSGKNESETKHKYNPDYKAKSTQTKKVDVYEFMDNEDAELFEFRPSTLMERFKNINSRDMPSTSKYVPSNDKTDYSSESGSDGDDFVYDDYVCSDEETENSLMSCELGNGKSGANETKKCGSSLKRKDVVEKNAVMGKIFKLNAVRSEKKTNKFKDCPKPRANLDQLFDSLLHDEPGPSTTTHKSPKNEEFVSPRKYELFRKQDCTTPKKYECLTPRNDETKKHEFSTPTKLESASPKKHSYSSSKKYDTTSQELESEVGKKHDSAFSRKHEHESYRKYHSSSSKKYECLTSESDDRGPIRKEQSVSPRKHESASRRKHDATSKYNSGKVYPLLSAPKKDSDSSSKTYESSSKHPNFDDKPSTSKKLNSSNRDLFRPSPKSFDSMTYSASIHEPSTSKMNYEGRRLSRAHEYTSANDYSSIKRHGSSSKKFDYDSSLRHSRDRSLTPELDEDNDSISDCGFDNEEDGDGREGGVAQQRARRKCTVGKQNVLAETWSSESDPDPGPGRPASAASGAAGVGRRRRGRRREAGARGGGARRREGAGSRRHSRPPAAAAADRRQQHGWIVGDSHKKLVTMLAHAKGRKRNHDDKRHNIH